MDNAKRTVTILFYKDGSLEINQHIGQYPQESDGRVQIPESFKIGKSIIAVVDGEVEVLNKVGDRVAAIEWVA
ncbi:TIGR02922 family protein [Thalassotalea agarivorans]|uniref:TIGR02922 family protein n=1 Tax=Thalassotalea agarivorans TaxID=349064 RepID=A0A1I0HTM1_THASX|nr:TIGR02922 family protein [Thalassotalea agarivorans]SET87539.1 TIGR02922 family protein [Thalassotalea agarivorans]